MVGPKAAAVGNGTGEQAVANGGKKLKENSRSEPNMALDRLKESEATEWLVASPSLVDCAKQASEMLFTLSATSFGKAPLSKLYTDKFDAEQIWQQIDLQSHPIISYIHRKVRNLEGSVNDDFFIGLETDAKEKAAEEKSSSSDCSLEKESDDASDDEEDEDAEAALATTNEDDEGDEKDEEDEHVSDDDEEDDEDEREKGEASKNGVEDEFFKLGEMNRFLERTDAGGVFGTGEDSREEASGLNEEEGEDDEVDEEDEEDEIFGEDFEVGTSDEGDGEEKEIGFGRYEDFFGRKKKTKQKLKPVQEGSKEEISDDEEGDADASQSLLESKPIEVEKLSSHERKQERMEKRIKQLEKANLDPKDWTQQGEVTAKRRPINSALEVELDFEHNARPPPVITEEVTASLEDMIKARIAEGRFDDVERKPVGPVAAARERVELDETKSREGLGDIYEAEYMQSSGLTAAPTSTSEELKEEAELLFRALCSKLDALSHFHYAPKPVVEDMSVRADVPALAMEEVAPLAVSDASMLAPEEIFKGEDAVKAEAELTREERKRRRGQKKRKRRGQRKAQEAEKTRKRICIGRVVPAEAKPTPNLKVGHSSYIRSSRMFAELDNVKHLKGKVPPQKGARETEKSVHASFLKL